MDRLTPAWPIETEEFTVERLIEASMYRTLSVFLSSIFFAAVVSLVIWIVFYPRIIRLRRKVGRVKFIMLIINFEIILIGLASWFINTNNIVSDPFIIP